MTVVVKPTTNGWNVLNGDDAFGMTNTRLTEPTKQKAISKARTVADSGERIVAVNKNGGESIVREGEGIQTATSSVLDMF